MLGLTAAAPTPDNSAKNHANNPNNAELFTIPPDQMPHIQVLTVESDNPDALAAPDWGRGL